MLTGLLQTPIAEFGGGMGIRKGYMEGKERKEKQRKRKEWGGKGEGGEGDRIGGEFASFALGGYRRSWPSRSRKP